MLPGAGCGDWEQLLNGNGAFLGVIVFWNYIERVAVQHCEYTEC